MCSFFFSSRRRHTRLQGDWSSDVCSSDLVHEGAAAQGGLGLPVAGPDAHAGLACVAPAPETWYSGARELRAQRVGGGVPATRRISSFCVSAFAGLSSLDLQRIWNGVHG